MRLVAVGLIRRARVELSCKGFRSFRLLSTRSRELEVRTRSIVSLRRDSRSRRGGRKGTGGT